MEDKKKILLISYYWPPSGGAGVQRILKFSKFLPDFGFEPWVVTVDDKVASYPLRDYSLIEEIPADLKVFRTHSFEPLSYLTRLTGNKAPYGGFANKDKEKFSQKILRFIRGNFFIPDARKGWIRYAFEKASALIEQEKINTVLISSPPHSSQIVGLKLKKRFPQLKWIADLRDPWTDIYYYKDMLHTRMAAEKDLKIERLVVDQADGLIVVSRPILEKYLSKSDKVNKAKFHVIPNGFDDDDFPEAMFKKNESFTITYTGTIADSYNPRVFFESLSIAMKANPEVRVKLRFVGGMTDSIASMIRENNLEAMVEFIPHVNHKEAIRYMRSSDTLLLVIPDVPGSEGILTGKLFEYLAARRPVICIGPRNGDAGGIITDCQAGRTFERTDQTRIAAYLEELMKLWSQGTLVPLSSRIFEKYSRKNLTMQLARILHINLNSIID